MLDTWGVVTGNQGGHEAVILLDSLAVETLQMIYLGQSAMQRAGNPVPPLTFGKEQKIREPVGGHKSRFSNNSI